MKTPTTVLLVVIAALLAANLIVNLSPQVGANPPRTALSGDDDDEVVLVGIAAVSKGGGNDPLRYVLRLWSDGVVEHRVASTLNQQGTIYDNDPLTWDPPFPNQILGWTEIVPLP